jgi:hypothetical protein
MSPARVVLDQRFDPGSTVTIVRVRDERTLRAGGGAAIGTGRADPSGSVTFNAGVEIGGRCLAVGVKDRQPLEVRARADKRDAARPQPPVCPDRPRRVRAPARDATSETSARRREDVHGVRQRSDTATGAAPPVD